MQCDAGMLHPALLERRYQLSIEMQTGGGRSDCARITRKNTLVACPILDTGGALDIRRQRHRAVRLEKLQCAPRRAHLPQVLLLPNDLHSPPGSGDFQAWAYRLAGT